MIFFFTFVFVSVFARFHLLFACFRLFLIVFVFWAERFWIDEVRFILLACSAIDRNWVCDIIPS